MVPGGFKHFADGEKAERVQDRRSGHRSVELMNRTGAASYWFFIAFKL
jgi:hypothetical protein